MQHTAAHCNTMQHTATRCHTLQHAAIYCCRLQHAATHTKYFQWILTRRQASVPHCNTLQHTATHCNTLRNTAAHYTTLQQAANFYLYIPPTYSMDTQPSPDSSSPCKIHESPSLCTTFSLPPTHVTHLNHIYIHIYVHTSNILNGYSTVAKLQ